MFDSQAYEDCCEAQHVAIRRPRDQVSAVGWCVLASAALLLIGAMLAGKIYIADIAIPEAVLLLLIFAGCGIALRGRDWERTGAAAEMVAQFLLAGLLAPLVSVVLARSNLPLRDSTLSAVDRALFGIDWRAIADIARSSPLLVKSLSYAYQSLMQQPQLLLALLFASSRLRTAQTFCQAWILTLALTIAIFPLVPAVGGYLYYGVARHETYVPVEAAWRHIEILGAARDGTLRGLDARSLEGIVTFPSFHAAAAVLIAWAFWSLPIVRWIALIVNLIMIASTPIIGGHYVIDVVAGVLIAVLALGLVTCLQRRREASIDDGPWIAATVHRYWVIFASYVRGRVRDRRFVQCDVGVPMRRREYAGLSPRQPARRARDIDRMIEAHGDGIARLRHVDRPSENGELADGR